MSKRFWIISVSIAAHGLAFLIAFIVTVWRIDRLDTTKTAFNLAVMLPPPAPSGGPEPGKKPQDDAPKLPPKAVTKDLTQPPKVEKPPEKLASAESTSGGGIGDKTGPGTNPDGETTDTGTCTGPACGPPTIDKVPEPPKVVIEDKPIIEPPQVFKANRFEGETNLPPPEIVKNQMLRDDHKRAVGTFKVCVDTQGTVSAVTTLASTKYAAYDALLMTAIRAWRYHPFTVGGKPVAVCSTVSFVYVMQ